MFAVAFDLVVAKTAQHHPKGVTQAYFDIGATLSKYGFERIQGSLYTTQSEPRFDTFFIALPMNVDPSADYK